MKKYQEMVDNCINTIINNKLPYTNCIIIGDNSSGKSEILSEVVKSQIKTGVYFIDSVNRTFDISKVEIENDNYKNLKMDFEKVVRARIETNYFNVRDYFPVFLSIEGLYMRYKSKMQELLGEFLDVAIDIRREVYKGVLENALYINGEKMCLSSGYQAVSRIFIELLYFKDLVNSNNLLNPLVVIDEIDEYLSPKNSASIFNFLIQKFQNFRFLVTTHSSDLIEHSSDFNLYILNNSTYEIYDSRDLREVVDIDSIFENLFFAHKNNIIPSNDEIDNQIRRLLNMKITENWTDILENEFNSIQVENLAPHQKLILKQIKEW